MLLMAIDLSFDRRYIQPIALDRMVVADVYTHVYRSTFRFMCSNGLFLDERDRA